MGTSSAREGVQRGVSRKKSGRRDRREATDGRFESVAGMEGRVERERERERDAERSATV